MGRTLVIVLTGFAISFGILAYSKDRRMLDSVDLTLDRIGNYSKKNTATSGAYLALNKLYINNGWRTGFSNIYLGTDSLAVIVDDDSTDVSIPANYIRVRSASYNSGSSDTATVMLYDGQFSDFPVWCKGSVTDVVDSTGAYEPNIIKQYAPFMPEIDKSGLIAAAESQSHRYDGNLNINDNDTYPASGAFMYDGTAANVTYVTGDLRIGHQATAYGIFVVDGEVFLHGLSETHGVIYQTGSGSDVQSAAVINPANVYGGIIARGNVVGTNRLIKIYQRPQYTDFFSNGFVPDDPQLRILSWK